MRPSPTLTDAQPYSVPRSLAPVDLVLDGNEGARPSPALLAALGSDPELLRRYPDARPLEEELAARLGIAPSQVVVTAGADEAIDRICRAILAPGRAVVLPVPGFEMTARYARLAGATAVEVPWPDGDFPTDAVIAAAPPETALVVVTTPNNPTGAVATAGDIRRLSAALPSALILVDAAYVEFADVDPSADALALPNAVVVRTLSKAWGLAGLRVGYAAGPPEVIGWLRVAGAPYPVSALSLALASARLDEQAEMDGFVERIRRERARLSAVLADVGLRPQPSQANFVLSRASDPLWIRDAMAGLGIGVRAFPGREGLTDAVRIACPGDDDALARLERALLTIRRPEALLFDMDGVLADVSQSYRAAIRETAGDFGVDVTDAEIERRKQQGDANCDWTLTWRIVTDRGVACTLAEVTDAFEARYQKLWPREGLLVDRVALAALSDKMPLAIVTGRPTMDAERFLQQHEIHGLFTAVICREGGPTKPDPDPVVRALAALDVTRAWMVGDTVDDVRAARAAGVLPLGVVAPGDPAGTAEILLRAGAARVLTGALALPEVGR